MAFSTRSVPSFTYLGTQADHLANRAASHLQNALDRIRNAIHILRNDLSVGFFLIMVSKSPLIIYSISVECKQYPWVNNPG